MKKIARTFKYVPAINTDIARTIRRELKRIQVAAKDKVVVMALRKRK